jgi:hypothetical protein
MNEKIDLSKYEGLIDAEGYIDYDGLDHLLSEVKRLREAIDYAIVHAENHDVIRVLDEVMEND